MLEYHFVWFPTHCKMVRAPSVPGRHWTVSNVNVGFLRSKGHHFYIASQGMSLLSYALWKEVCSCYLIVRGPANTYVICLRKLDSYEEDNQNILPKFYEHMILWQHDALVLVLGDNTCDVSLLKKSFHSTNMWFQGRTGNILPFSSSCNLLLLNISYQSFIQNHAPVALL